MFLAKKLNNGAGTPAVLDAQFNQTTMLLHGDGTNGAQNNTFIDSSTSNLTITRNGNTTQGSFSPYGSNWSNYFDGSGDYLDVPTSSANSVGSGSFCLEAWIYMENASAQQFLVANASSGGLWIGFNIDAANKFAIGRVATAIDNEVSYTWVNGQWYHIAVNKSGTNLQFFVNGTQVGSTGTNSVTYSSQGYRIGCETTQKFFTGYISNFRLTRASVYTSTFTPSTVPLQQITDTVLLTCKSNNFDDKSNNNFGLTPNGNLSVQRFSPFGASTAYSTSVVGGSGYFDGAGDSLTVGNPSVDSGLALGANDFTIQAWIYPLGTGTYTILSSLANNSGNGSYWFMVNGTYSSGGILQFGYNYVLNGGGGNDAMLGSGVLKPNAWSFVAVTREGGSIRGYVNGVQAGSTNNTIGTRTIYPQNQNLLIGRNVDSDAFATNGYLSDVQLINGTALYTGATMTVPTAPSSPVTNTTLLTKFQNAAIFDNAMMNNLETVGNAQISTSVKKYGTGSMYFDGTGDYLVIPASPNLTLGTGDFTVEFWINVPSFANFRQHVSTRPSDSANYWSIDSKGDNKFYFYTDTFVVTSAAQSTNTWIHIAAVRSSGTLNLYIDGVSQGSASLTNNFLAYPLSIGATASGNQTMTGYIDDLRITKGYARYTATFTPPTAAFPNIGPT